MPRVIGIGAGGHAKILVEILRKRGGWELAGFTDRREDLRGSMFQGVRVLGDDRLLPELRAQGIEGAFVGVGAIRDVRVRKHLFLLAESHGFEMVTLVSPQAYVAPSARLGRGVAVLPGAVVNSDVELGDNVTVYSGTIVEHDCVICDHVHLSPGAALGGGVRVEPEAFVGIGACIIQGIRIGSRAVVGAGAAVIRDVEPGCTVVGVPARVVSRKEATA